MFRCPVSKISSGTRTRLHMSEKWIPVHGKAVNEDSAELFAPMSTLHPRARLREQIVLSCLRANQKLNHHTANDPRLNAISRVGQDAEHTLGIWGYCHMRLKQHDFPSLISQVLMNQHICNEILQFVSRERLWTARGGPFTLFRRQ